MSKTLLRTFSPSNHKTTLAASTQKSENELLGGEMKNMKDFWQQASEELLQPRPEAVAMLLKKIGH
ncbi:hypothetical protein [Taibaiella soli]|uniref:Uncharacterized protein n=1 Tax=Taibaiella soli TaxID=1649169 RepID=A0A2W2AX46_9BACT|nr:hypothetical protein [Taibaiella soli]PZF72554.1 hypothetical protein DN068_11865 [Taibaiella soli]